MSERFHAPEKRSGNDQQTASRSLVFPCNQSFNDALLQARAHTSTACALDLPNLIFAGGSKPQSALGAKPSPDKVQKSEHRAKSALGQFLEQRYQGMNLTAEQTDNITKTADHLYGGQPTPEQARAATKNFDRMVTGMTGRAVIRNSESAGAETAPGHGENGRAQLSPAQKAFAEKARKLFPDADFTAAQQSEIADDAAAFASKNNDYGDGSLAKFHAQEKEKLKRAFGKESGQLITSDIMEHLAKASDSLGTLTDGYKSLTAMSAVSKEIPLGVAALGSEGELSLLPKLVRGTAEAAPYVAGAFYVASGLTKTVEGDSRGGISTMNKGLFSIDAAILGSLACGGPEDGLGIACGIGASTYADHVWDTYSEKGPVEGTRILARETKDALKNAAIANFNLEAEALEMGITPSI